MIVGGLFWLWLEYHWFSRPNGRGLGGGSGMILVGIFYVWFDFIAPLLRIRAGEK
jgi:hypothetical protein